MHTTAATPVETDLQFLRRNFRRFALFSVLFPLFLCASLALTTPELQQELARALLSPAVTPAQVQGMQGMLSGFGLLTLAVSALGTLLSSLLLTHLGLCRIMGAEESGPTRALCTVAAVLGLGLTVFSLLCLWRVAELVTQFLTRLLGA